MLVLALMLSGCRLYGGYDAEERNMEAIQAANEAFEQDLVQMQRDVNVLEQGAANDPALKAFVDRLSGVVLAHETILQEHKEIHHALSEGSFTTYLNASRALSGILTEMEVIRARYRELMPGGQFAGDPRAMQAWNDLEESRYYVVPPYYQRVIQRNRMVSFADSMAQGRLRLPTPDSSLAGAVDAPVPGAQDSLHATPATEGAQPAPEAHP